MLYNKNQVTKTNDKKILHKIGKHWVTLSVATLMALGGYAMSSTLTTHAATNPNNNGNNDTNNTDTKGVTNEANDHLQSAQQNASQGQRSNQNSQSSAISTQAITKTANIMHQRIINNGLQQNAAMPITGQGNNVQAPKVNIKPNEENESKGSVSDNYVNSLQARAQSDYADNNTADLSNIEHEIAQHSDAINANRDADAKNYADQQNAEQAKLSNSNAQKNAKQAPKTEQAPTNEVGNASGTWEGLNYTSDGNGTITFTGSLGDTPSDFLSQGKYGTLSDNPITDAKKLIFGTDKNSVDFNGQSLENMFNDSPVNNGGPGSSLTDVNFHNVTGMSDITNMTNTFGNGTKFANLTNVEFGNGFDMSGAQSNDSGFIVPGIAYTKTADNYVDPNVLENSTLSNPITQNQSNQINSSNNKVFSNGFKNQKPAAAPVKQPDWKNDTFTEGSASVKYDTKHDIMTISGGTLGSDGSDSAKAMPRWIYDKTNGSYVGSDVLPNNKSDWTIKFDNVTAPAHLYFAFDGKNEHTHKLNFIGNQVKEVDLSGLKTSGTTNMEGMLINNPKLQKVDFGNIDTSNVTNMAMMLGSDPSLTSADLSSLSGQSLNQAWDLFDTDKNLKSVDLSSKFSPKGNNVNLGEMFASDVRLPFNGIHWNGYSTTNATQMYGFFRNDHNLGSVTLPSSFDTQNVWNFGQDIKHGNQNDGMFQSDMAKDFKGKYNKSKLLYTGQGMPYLDLSQANFDTHSATNMNEMFGDDKSLKTLNLGNKFNTSNVNNMNLMFGYSDGMSSLTLPAGFDTSSARGNMANMFESDYEDGGLRTIKISSPKTIIDNNAWTSWQGYQHPFYKETGKLTNSSDKPQTIAQDHDFTDSNLKNSDASTGTFTAEDINSGHTAPSYNYSSAADVIKGDINKASVSNNNVNSISASSVNSTASGYATSAGDDTNSGDITKQSSVDASNEPSVANDWSSASAEVSSANSYKSDLSNLSVNMSSASTANNSSAASNDLLSASSDMASISSLNSQISTNNASGSVAYSHMYDNITPNQKSNPNSGNNKQSDTDFVLFEDADENNQIIRSYQEYGKNGTTMKINGNIPSGYKLANGQSDSFTFDNGTHSFKLNAINKANDNIPVDDNTVDVEGSIDLKFTNGNQVKNIYLPYMKQTELNQGSFNVLSDVDPSVSAPSGFVGKNIQGFDTSNYSYTNNANPKDINFTPSANDAVYKNGSTALINHNFELDFNSTSKQSDQPGESGNMAFDFNYTNPAGKTITVQSKSISGKNGQPVSDNNVPTGYHIYNSSNKIPAFKNGSTHVVNILPNRDDTNIVYVDKGNRDNKLTSDVQSGNAFNAKDASDKPISDESIDINAKNEPGIPAGYHLVSNDNNVPFDNKSHNVEVVKNAPGKVTDYIVFRGDNDADTSMTGTDGTQGTVSVPAHFQLKSGENSAFTFNGGHHYFDVSRIPDNDTITFNGEKGSNTKPITGASDTQGTVTAPKGYHFNDGNTVENFIFGDHNGKHSFDVSADQAVADIEFIDHHGNVISNGHYASGNANSDVHINTSNASQYGLQNGYSLDNNDNDVKLDNKVHVIPVTGQNTDYFDYVDAKGNIHGGTSLTGASDTTTDIKSGNDAGLDTGYQLANPDNNFNFDGQTHIVPVVGQSKNYSITVNVQKTVNGQNDGSAITFTINENGNVGSDFTINPDDNDIMNASDGKGKKVSSDLKGFAPTTSDISVLGHRYANGSTGINDNTVDFNYAAKSNAQNAVTVVYKDGSNVVGQGSFTPKLAVGQSSDATKDVPVPADYTVPSNESTNYTVNEGQQTVTIPVVGKKASALSSDTNKGDVRFNIILEDRNGNVQKVLTSDVNEGNTPVGSDFTINAPQENGYSEIKGGNYFKGSILPTGANPYSHTFVYEANTANVNGIHFKNQQGKDVTPSNGGTASGNTNGKVTFNIPAGYHLPSDADYHFNNNKQIVDKNGNVIPNNDIPVVGDKVVGTAHVTLLYKQSNGSSYNTTAKDAQVILHGQVGGSQTISPVQYAKKGYSIPNGSWTINFKPSDINTNDQDGFSFSPSHTFEYDATTAGNVEVAYVDMDDKGNSKVGTLDNDGYPVVNHQSLGNFSGIVGQEVRLAKKGTGVDSDGTYYDLNIPAGYHLERTYNPIVLSNNPVGATRQLKALGITDAPANVGMVLAVDLGANNPNSSHTSSSSADNNNNKPANPASNSGSKASSSNVKPNKPNKPASNNSNKASSASSNNNTPVKPASSGSKSASSSNNTPSQPNSSSASNHSNSANSSNGSNGSRSNGNNDNHDNNQPKISNVTDTVEFIDNGHIVNDVASTGINGTPFMANVPVGYKVNGNVALIHNNTNHIISVEPIDSGNNDQNHNNVQPTQNVTDFINFVDNGQIINSTSNTGVRGTAFVAQVPSGYKADNGTVIVHNGGLHTIQLSPITNNTPSTPQSSSNATNNNTPATPSSASNNTVSPASSNNNGSSTPASSSVANSDSDVPARNGSNSNSDSDVDNTSNDSDGDADNDGSNSMNNDSGTGTTGSTDNTDDAATSTAQTNPATGQSDDESQLGSTNGDANTSTSSQNDNGSNDSSQLPQTGESESSRMAIAALVATLGLDATAAGAVLDRRRHE